MTETQCRADVAGTAADPYDLAAVLERLLGAAMRGERGAAESALAIFLRLEPAPALRNRLQGIATGRIRVVCIEGVYFVAPPEGVPLDAIASCISKALDTLAALLERPRPLIWVDLPGPPSNASVTYAELPGVRRMSLATRLFGEPEWDSVIWHECAHAILMAGCRFLDEGWAVWCQYRFTETTRYPLEREALEGHALPEVIAGIPIQGVLRCGASDLTFQRHAQNEDEQRAMYVRACRFFDGLQKRAGMVGIARAFDRIWNGADTLTVLNALCGGSVAELERDLMPTIAGIDRAFRALRIQSRHNASEPFLGFVRAHLREQPEDVRALRLFGRLLSHALLTTYGPENAVSALGGELDSVIARLVALDAADPIACMLQAFKHLRAGVVAMARDDMAQVVGDMMAAERHLSDAEFQAPDEGDVRLARARFEMRRPVPERAAALEHLAAAARDPDCLEEALALAGELSGFSGQASAHSRQGSG